MKILVTGATGFIGRHLVLHLSAQHEIHALVRNARQTVSRKRISIVVSDLARPLDSSMLPAQVDVIIHLAQANVPFPEAANELFAVNTSATQQLLNYGRRVGARRFILPSSGYVYGHRLGPCRETDAAVPASFYAVTKYTSELLALAYSGYLEPCILRLFWPYGPGQSNRLIPRLADRIRQGKPIRLHKDDCPHISTPVYIDDVVIAFERAIHASYSGIINVAGDTVVSMRDLAKAIGRVLESQPVFEKTNEETGDVIGDNTRMKQVFGVWPMVGLTEGLSRTFEN